MCLMPQIVGERKPILLAFVTRLAFALGGPGQRPVVKVASRFFGILRVTVRRRHASNCKSHVASSETQTQGRETQGHELTGLFTS